MGRPKVNRNETRFPYFQERLLELKGRMTLEQFAKNSVCPALLWDSIWPDNGYRML